MLIADGEKIYSLTPVECLTPNLVNIYAPRMSHPRLRIKAAELRRRRLKATLSRQDLGRLSGISSKRIEQIENGYSGVKPETARALAEALGCEPSELTEVTEAAS